MGKGCLIIKLLSDACPASGEAFNSTIDTDICYDDLGFPYIPGKRIKGCLRESAIELGEWGYPIDVEAIFGGPKDKKGRLQLSSAWLEHREQLMEQLEEARRGWNIAQQDVINAFSYIRTQTAMDPKTGTADENTLRVTRVLRKGLIFRAEVAIPCEYVADFKKCCANLRFIGLNRTRGLGEVQVSFEEYHDTDAEKKPALLLEKGYDRYRLDYSLDFRSPVRFDGVGGDKSHSEQYVEGSKILGAIAQLDQASFLDLMNQDELICSNAYISQEGIRYVPAPASLFIIKDDASDLREWAVKNGKQAQKEEKDQVNPLGGFIQDNQADVVKKCGVDMEIHYHHARPEDKSIGHAGEDGAFYQIESISDGQTFKGFIIGNGAQISRINEGFQRTGELHLGNSRGAGYGDVHIRVEKVEPVRKEDECLQSAFVIKLEAPLIEYNENGMYTTDIEPIKTEISKILGCDDLEVENSFFKYRQIAGYNTTWHLYKPTLNVLDKGTVIVFRKKEGKVDINCLKNQWLGERVNEGYGEIAVYPLGGDTTKTLFHSEAVRRVSDVAEVRRIAEILVSMMGDGRLPERRMAEPSDIERIVLRKIKLACINMAREDAAEKMEKYGREINNGSLVSAMRIAFGENETFESYRKTLEERFDKGNEDKRRKGHLTRNMLNIHSRDSLEPDVQENRYIDMISEKDVYQWYERAFIEELKYLVKQEKGKEAAKGKGHEE